MFTIKVMNSMLLQFNYQLLKDVEDRTIGGPLSVTLAEIHIIRMKNNVAIPLKPIFMESLLMVSLIVAKRMLQVNYFFN